MKSFPSRKVYQTKIICFQNKYQSFVSITVNDSTTLPSFKQRRKIVVTVKTSLNLL